MKKLLFLVVSLFSLVLFSCGNSQSYDVVATTFIGYDAAREVMGENNIKMLIKPASDIHSYEPTPSDIRAVLSCKVFIYVGGESDEEWVSDILENAKDKDIKIVNMFEVLEDRLILEDGEEDEYDEHVWTDPNNYKLIVEAVKDALILALPENKAIYEENTNKYISSLKELDTNIKKTISDNNIDTIVVADRFPFLYFVKAYNLNYLGALNGCSTDKNVPLTKIIELKNKVEEKKLKAIYIIELSDGKIAETVKSEIDKDIENNKYDGNSPIILTFYSMQNITSADFDKGLTYIDFMKLNIDNLAKVN